MACRVERDSETTSASCWRRLSVQWLQEQEEQEKAETLLRRSCAAVRGRHRFLGVLDAGAAIILVGLTGIAVWTGGPCLSLGLVSAIVLCWSAGFVQTASCSMRTAQAQAGPGPILRKPKAFLVIQGSIIAASSQRRALNICGHPSEMSVPRPALGSRTGWPKCSLVSLHVWCCLRSRQPQGGYLYAAPLLAAPVRAAPVRPTVRVGPALG